MSKEKIIIGFSGGLGNQMFNYALGRSLSIRHNLDFIIDTSFYKSSQNIFNEDFKLQNFKIKKNIEFNQSLSNNFFRFLKVCKILTKENSINFKIPNMYFKTDFENVYLERRFEFEKKIVTQKPDTNSYYYGYWQSVYYFDEIKNFLFDEFDQINIRDLKIKNFVKDEISETTVAIHIRGGDMEDDKLMNYVPVNFYKNGIKYFKKKFFNIKFHIFTDDIVFAKDQAKKIFDRNENILFIKDLYFNDLEEFNLLRHYSNYLLARSTFSWWAAYLSLSKTKKVILPSIWFKNQKTPIDRIAKNMITMSDDKE